MTNSRVPKGLSFAVEARRGSLDMGTSTVEVSSKGGRDVGGCLRHFSRPSCTPRARREASPKGYRFAYAKAYRSAYPLG